MNERKVPAIGWWTTAAAPVNVLTPGPVEEPDAILLLEPVVVVLDVTGVDTVTDEVADDDAGAAEVVAGVVVDDCGAGVALVVVGSVVVVVVSTAGAADTVVDDASAPKLKELQ